MKKIIFVVFFIFASQLAFLQCIPESDFLALNWSSYLGGLDEDEVRDLVVEKNTKTIYVVGVTSSTNFYSTNPVLGNSTSQRKTFVAAVNADATLKWSTIIEGWEDPHSIYISPDGNVVLVGTTDNPNIASNSLVPGFDKTHNGSDDIVIFKLDNQGQSIIYSTYYGGSGSERGQKTFLGNNDNDRESKLKVSYYEERVYILGGSSSTNLPIVNEFDSNIGSAFACVFDLNLIDGNLLFSTYLRNQNGGITSIPDGGAVIITNSGDGAYQQHISSNAIANSYDGYEPLPILIKLNSSFQIEYGSYIGAWQGPEQSPNGEFLVVNGNPGLPNYFDYQLKSDECGNVFWYSKGRGFRAPFLPISYLLSAQNYYPQLATYDNPSMINVGSPLLKINFQDDATTPYIEFMIFFGFSGATFGASDFDIDESGRVHLAARQESYNMNEDIPASISPYQESYLIYDNDLERVTGLNFGNSLANLSGNAPNLGIRVIDNKAYIFGTIFDVLDPISANWVDEYGNNNSIIQQSFGGGNTDGFITVIDNNELCECCGADLCCNHLDIAGLQAFYDESSGDQWNSTVNGNNPWFEDCDPCGIIDGTPWFGVGCNSVNRVITLGLNNNNLVGEITQDIDLLSELSGVVLYDNPGLTGVIPNSICNLNRLATFYIYRNNHIGVIPSCMSNMSSLIDINIIDNSIQGAIPNFGSGTPNLGNLNLSNNDLIGGLPQSLADIPNPSKLTFNNNNLSGCYPDGLLDLCNNNSGTIQGLDNSTVSDGNNFDTSWDDFCSTGAGACTVSTHYEFARAVFAYPNPFENHIVVDHPDGIPIVIDIYDNNGELIISEEGIGSTSLINMSERSKGLYLLKVCGESGCVTTKILKL